uniref:Uncharacterized protein n=1 Tax=Panagrolaimus superbus TaxID=310955 RepID=A0A914YA59_9BILA
MGRRKQANPIRVGPDDVIPLAATTTTTTNSSTTSPTSTIKSTSSSTTSIPSPIPPPKLSPSTTSTTTSTTSATINGFGPTATKKPKTDFSIKSHLEGVSAGVTASSSKPTPSTSSFNHHSSLSPHSLSNALKAYETLLNELNRQPNGLKPGPLLQLTKQVDKLASRDGKRDPGMFNIF